MAEPIHDRAGNGGYVANAPAAHGNGYACPGPHLKVGLELLYLSLDRTAQVWVSTDDQPPSLHTMLVDLRAYGAVASKPKRAFWTSTVTSGHISPWLTWLQVGEDRRAGPYYPWRLEVPLFVVMFAPE